MVNLPANPPPVACLPSSSVATLLPSNVPGTRRFTPGPINPAAQAAHREGFALGSQGLIASPLPLHSIAEIEAFVRGHEAGMVAWAGRLASRAGGVR